MYGMMKNLVFPGIKILIVEDDVSSRIYLNKILEKTGALLLNAGDGEEAVSMTYSDPDIKLILMDIQLPVIDGYTAARRIKEVLPGIKIIAQTAYGMTGDMENIIESGFDDYIVKPIFSNQLIDLIKRHIQQD